MARPLRPAGPTGQPRHRPHFYMDVFGAGQFGGKGLVDVDAWRAVLPGVITLASALNHDVLEGFYARAANLGDLRMSEGEMGRYLVQARVDQRWMRGECQLVPWLFPRVRDGEGRARRNPVPWTLRLRLLRLVLLAFDWPSVLLVLLLGWTVLPGSAWAWTAVALSQCMSSSAVSTATRLQGAVRRGEDLRAGWRGYLDELLYRGFRVGVLAHWAVLAGDAATRGVWRALVSRRLRTQWTTQQQSAQQPLALGHYLRTMWASVAVGAGVLPLVAATAPERLPAAAPFALLWMTAPLWVWRMDHPLSPAAPRTLDVEAAAQPSP